MGFYDDIEEEVQASEVQPLTATRTDGGFYDDIEDETIQEEVNAREVSGITELTP